MTKKYWLKLLIGVDIFFISINAFSIKHFWRLDKPLGWFFILMFGIWSLYLLSHSLELNKCKSEK